MELDCFSEAFLNSIERLTFLIRRQQSGSLNAGHRHHNSEEVPLSARRLMQNRNAGARAFPLAPE
jgi:hypothetical protein